MLGTDFTIGLTDIIRLWKGSSHHGKMSFAKIEVNYIMKEVSVKEFHEDFTEAMKIINRYNCKVHKEQRITLRHLQVGHGLNGISNPEFWFKLDQK